jgi:hypothetical protein
MLSDTEQALILICARQILSAELAAQAREILRTPLKWNEITQAASRHGVASLLFHNLQALDAANSVTQEDLHLLRQNYVRAAFRNETHYAVIAEMLQAAKAAGIDVVLMKGAALARTLYQDAALRPFADVDLLVRREHIEDAKQVLLVLGYELAPGLLSEKFSRKYHINLPLVRRSPQPVHVELHWRLSDPFSLTAFDEEALFARARDLLIGESNSLVLGQEDQFVYLAAHLDNHGYLNRMMVDRDAPGKFLLHELSGDRLIWFTDLHELSVAGLDWAKVLESARAARACDALAISLRLLPQLLGTPIPDNVISELALPQMRWPKRKIGHYVFSLAARPPSDSSAAKFQQRFLSTRKGFELRLIRLLDLWQYIFPRAAAITKSYPAHVWAALLHCSKMFLELVYRRALRRIRAVP